jgi:hypothetical protein
VYVGWIPMMAPDANPQVADLLVDDRARHYWDGNTELGRFVARLLGRDDGAAAWDIFLVYGPDATWGDRPEVVGTPVISESGRLEHALRGYLGTGSA